MLGLRQTMQETLFYGFSLERAVPGDHLLRRIDALVDLSEVRAHLAAYYSATGRPLIDPELMIRMLIVGYCFSSQAGKNDWTTGRVKRAALVGDNQRTLTETTQRRSRAPAPTLGLGTRD